MLARVRARLSYANVVATIALFVALGGTGYAAHQITSKDIKNRTIKGGDVKKNALGGTEINERKLRTVPRATRAQTAGAADISKQADSATQATNSLNADVANVARDANTLAGQSAAAFEQSSRMNFGRAGATPVGPPDEQAVVSWPEMGVALTTSSSGCGPGQARIAVRNTKGSGAIADVFEDGAGFIASVGAGGVHRFCGTSSGSDVSGTVLDSTGRTLFYDCLMAGGELRCLGIRSEP